jgi:hypothetical protein
MRIMEMNKKMNESMGQRVSNPKPTVLGQCCSWAGHAHSGGRDMRTEDELLGGCQHVETESHFVLVALAL